MFIFLEHAFVLPHFIVFTFEQLHKRIPRGGDNFNH